MCERELFGADNSCFVKGIIVVPLVSSLREFDTAKQENMVLFVSSKVWA